MTKLNRIMFSLLSFSVITVTIIGCNTDSANNKPGDSSQTNTSNTDGNTETLPPVSDDEHAHTDGAHGGLIVSLGRDSYHIEAVVDSEGSIRLYTLGKDETRVIEVESQTLHGFVKADGETDSQSLAFEPQPQEGDSEGKTSLFVGKLPKEFVGRKLDVTIPNIRIAGERFRLGFATGDDSHETGEAMPEKIADTEENELYLTPGGRYTAADVAANGKMTASQKFKGIKSTHDMKPKVGDRLCPITETKANPNFTWIIDGKPYEFCCPPCVDEFLKMAKSTDEPLPAPETFIKK